jgi:Zn ribbon nucleic-acid-binding protein
MNDIIRMTVELPPDEHGMVGRECPECKGYFKLKLGTGLPHIETTTCPYCEKKADSSSFLTEAQREYAISVAANKVIGPALRNLERTLKELERTTRGSFIQIKVSTSSTILPIKYYSESDLETTVECDYCGLVFSIFGVFAVCPDCQRPNSMSMFLKSIDAIRKRLDLYHRIPTDEIDLRVGVLIDCTSACVSTFDSLGKRLRLEYPELLPSRPRNLFQNLEALDDALMASMGLDLEVHLGKERYGQLNHMFQIRHIWNHNFGEADEDFIARTGADTSLLGKKIVPKFEEVRSLLEIVSEIGIDVRKQLGDST